MQFLSNKIHMPSISLITLMFISVSLDMNGMEGLPICDKSGAKVAPAPDDKSKKAKDVATKLLADAVLGRDYDGAKTALDQRANPNGCYTLSYFIEQAIENNYEKMVTLLLDHKANINFDERLRPSPLMQSASTTVQIFKLLLDRNANVKYRTSAIFPENVLCTLIDQSPSSNGLKKLPFWDRLSCILMVMEKPELDDTDFECAYKYGYTFQKQSWLLNEARLEDYKRKQKAIMTALTEITQLSIKSQKIIADYGIEYHCMKTRPLTIKKEIEAQWLKELTIIQE